MARNRRVLPATSEVERKFDVPSSRRCSRRSRGSPWSPGWSGFRRSRSTPSTSTHPATTWPRTTSRLRRRTGGPDAGWHLKLPAGPDARTEVRAPLDGGDAPTATDGARRAARRRAGDRARPPAGPGGAHLDHPDRRRALRARRRAGGRVLRRPGDRVGRRRRRTEQQWREWELELAEGAGDADLLDRLANRLLDAGAATGRARLEAGPGARSRRHRPPSDREAAGRSGAPRRRRAGRPSCWSGIARCGPTSTTRCTRCG